IGPQDTYGTLAQRLQRIGGELLVRALDESPPCAEQDEARVTYADKITAADRQLDPGRPAEELERTVRALTPHIGAYVALADGTPLGVREARVGPPQGETQPGAISLDGPLPVLATADGTLELVVVQPPGKRPMPGGDYLRGLRGARPRPSAAPSRQHEPVRTPWFAESSSTGHTPTGSWLPRRRRWTHATGHSRWRSLTARSSACERWITWPSGSPAARWSGSTRPCSRLCG